MKKFYFKFKGWDSCGVLQNYYKKYKVPVNIQKEFSLDRV